MLSLILNMPLKLNSDWFVSFDVRFGWYLVWTIFRIYRSLHILPHIIFSHYKDVPNDVMSSFFEALYLEADWKLIDENERSSLPRV